MSGILPQPPNKQRLVWLDMEMTGLDPNVNEVLEVALLVTELDLQIIAEGPHLILRQKPETFATMDKWNQHHHNRSGLWEKALNSDVTVAAAEEAILNFLQPLVGQNQGLLAGNSIWQDRRFIRTYMPKLDAYLHYRMIDVSSVKTLAQAWYKGLGFKKKEAHRADEDVKESLAELAYYRSECFRPLLDTP